MYFYKKINLTYDRSLYSQLANIVLALALVFQAACSTNLQSKVAGNLNQMSKQQTVAILPVEILKKGQEETGEMLRQGLYANLKGAKFNLLERYVVDGLLKQHNLHNPAEFLKINPMQFAEILGADAVLITRINKVERSYMVIHSSIEIGISAQLVDTRTGEILWRAEQTEQDYQGIAKIPTGISSAVLGPIQFVTNKLNLHRMTSKLVNKLTAIVKNPEDAKKKETFKETLISTAATRDLKKIKDVESLKNEWADDVSAYTEIPSDLISPKKSLLSKTHKNQGSLPSNSKPAILESKNKLPSKINWRQRKTILKPTIPQQKTNITPVQKLKQNQFPQYTIQVGAYKTEENARQMVNRLLKKGYEAHIKSELKQDTPLFKVLVEKFNNKDKAYDLANKLINKENLPSFIVTTANSPAKP
jgi:cell division septation protein DedD